MYREQVRLVGGFWCEAISASVRYGAEHASDVNGMSAKPPLAQLNRDKGARWERRIASTDCLFGLIGQYSLVERC